MIGCVTGRRDSGYCRPVERQRFTILEHLVRPIVAVERRIGARSDRLQRQGRATDDRRPGALGKWPRRRTVVAMGVGAHDRRHRPARDCLFQRRDMFGKVRAGIDHRDLALPNHIALGAVISECRRIMRQHPRDPRLQLFQFRIRCVHLLRRRVPAPRPASSAARGGARTRSGKLRRTAAPCCCSN